MAHQQAQAFDDLRNTVTGVLRVLRQRWRFAILGLTAAGSAAFWCSQYVPREYTATTLFERRDDAVLQNLIQSNSPYSFDHLKSTLTLDMTGSRALAEAAVRAGLLPAETFSDGGALSDSERAVLESVSNRFKLRVSVRMPHSSPSLDTILLQCNATDPVVARALVVAVRDNYIADTRERIREILHSTRQFFEAEVARREERRTQTELELRKEADDYPGLDPTDIASVGNRLEELRGEHNTVYQRKAELEAQIAAREEFLVSAPAQLADPADASTGPAAVDPIVARGIEEVKAQILEHITVRSMTMEHPDVKRLVSRLEALEGLRSTLAAAAPGLVGSAPTGSPNSEVHRDWRAQQMRVDLELDALRRQLAIVGQQWEEVTARLERFTGLYDRLVANGDELRQLRERRGEAAVELGLWRTHLVSLERVLTAESGERGTQFVLIEEPKDNSVPTRPQVSAVFLICSLIGVASAVLLVALAELFDRSFRSATQVTRALGIPVLESIGVISTPRERRRVWVSRLIWAPAIVVLVLGLAATAILAYTSLVNPSLHQEVLQRVEGVSSAVDIVPGEVSGAQPT
jgi:hypothetical protein